MLASIPEERTAQSGSDDECVKQRWVILIAVLSVLTAGTFLFLGLTYLVFLRINLLGFAMYMLLISSFTMIVVGVWMLFVRNTNRLMKLTSALLITLSALFIYLWFGWNAFEELTYSFEHPSDLALSFEGQAQELFNDIYDRGGCSGGAFCADIRTSVLIGIWLREAGHEAVMKCFGDKANEVLGSFFKKAKKHVKRVIFGSNKNDGPELGSNTFCTIKGPLFATLAFVYHKAASIAFFLLGLSFLQTTVIGLKLKGSLAVSPTPTAGRPHVVETPTYQRAQSPSRI